MAAKQFRVGKFYFDQGFYESANIYFESAVEDYPNAPVIPDILYTLYLSYRRLGFDAEADVTRQRVLTDYPNTEADRLPEHESGAKAGGCEHLMLSARRVGWWAGG
jgi:outer membrane protein assembly factor BamD (BamD/ComL family)